MEAELTSISPGVRIGRREVSTGLGVAYQSNWAGVLKLHGHVRLEDPRLDDGTFAAGALYEVVIEFASAIGRSG
jgi:hypothetical protein